VYERLQNSEETSEIDRVARLGVIWAAVIALTAFAYFEITPEWVSSAWAALVLVLMLVAWWLGRTIFIAQALVLLLAAGGRAVAFNIFFSPPLSTSFWSTRTTSVLATCAVLLLALPLAFSFRRRSEDAPDTARAHFLQVVLAHPEQGLFFVPLPSNASVSVCPDVGRHDYRVLERTRRSGLPLCTGRERT